MRGIKVLELSSDYLIMTAKKDPNKKHYFELASKEDFTHTMNRHCSQEHSPPITIWEKGEPEDDAEIYEANEYNPETQTIKLTPTGKLLTKITGSTKAGKQVLVKVPIEDKINYFTGGKLQFHPDELSYTLEIQQEIYKSQARVNYRLNSSEVIPIKFKIDNQVFDALDISISGTSFEIEAHDAERFNKGKIFKDCTLNFDRKNYYIPFAHIAVLIPLTDENSKPNGNFKVGVSFKDLHRKTEEELYIKISTEARGEEMKKKFDIILSKKE